MQLSRGQLEPFLSPYLSGGWRQDEVVLNNVVFEPARITGWLDVEAHFMPGDGAFHLTVPIAFLWTAQLAIIYACLEHGLSEKPGEVYLRGIELQCRGRISDTKDIPISLALRSRRYLKEGVYYVGGIDIGQGAFVGEGKFVIPMPKEHRKG